MILRRERVLWNGIFILCLPAPGPAFTRVALASGRTWVYYRTFRKQPRMPLLLGFARVTLFIWAAENIGTFAAVWIYPNQQHGWELVTFGKCGRGFCG